MGIIEKLASAGYLTGEQATRARENARAFIAEMDSDPSFPKSAGFGGDVMGHLDPAKTVAGIISAGLIVGAATGGRDIYDAVKGKITHHRSFGKMMEMNPALKNHDKKMVNAAFNTLHRFNPDYASDPLVAGTFVQNALDMSRVDVGTVNSLVDANSKLQRDTGMNIADALKFVQFKDEPVAHPSQVALWEAQTAGAGKPVGYSEAQMAAWKAQAAKGEAERHGVHARTQGDLLKMRQQMGHERERHTAQLENERAMAKKFVKREAARAEMYRQAAGKK
jgi:hypothetical protein